MRCPNCQVLLNRRIDLQLIIVFTLAMAAVLSMTAWIFNISGGVSIGSGLVVAAATTIILAVAWVVDVVTVRLVVPGRFRGLWGYEV